MNEFQQYLLGEFVDDYEAGRLGRRDFILRVVGICGGVAASMHILAPHGFTEADVAAAQVAPPPPQQQTMDAVTVSPDHPAIHTEMVRIPLPGETMPLQAYYARPAAPGAYPGIVIIHENRGLLEHYKDIARRYALNGFAAVVPDLLSREGGTAAIADSSQVPGLLSQADPQRHADDAMVAGAWLRRQVGVLPSEYGITGFCFGGGVAWRVAVQDPAATAAVAYYGINPPLDQIPGSNAAILGIYGEEDARINAGIPELQTALEAAGVRHELLIYPNAGHAFFNDTGQRFAPEAAADAWERTISWFRRFLPDAVTSGKGLAFAK